MKKVKCTELEKNVETSRTLSKTPKWPSKLAKRFVSTKNQEPFGQTFSDKKCLSKVLFEKNSKDFLYISEHKKWTTTHIHGKPLTTVKNPH